MRPAGPGLALAAGIFQFQNGTIMREMKGRTATGADGFQFQNGTIMSLGLFPLAVLLLLISIPKWYDYEFSWW